MHFVCPLSIKQWEVKLHKRRCVTQALGKRKALSANVKRLQRLESPCPSRRGSANVSGVVQAKLILLSGRKADYLIPLGFFLPYFL